MRFQEYYLTEIKTDVTFGSPYSDFENRKLVSYIHIDNTTKQVTVNTSKNFQNSTTFKITIRKLKTDVLDDIYTFEFFDSLGNKHKTGVAGNVAATLFGALEKIFVKLIDDLPKTAVIIFSSELKEKERIGIYDFFIKKIRTVYPYILTEEDFTNNGLPLYPTHKFYGFAKSKDVYKKIHKTNIISSLIEKAKGILDKLA